MSTPEDKLSRVPENGAAEAPASDAAGGSAPPGATAPEFAEGAAGLVSAPAGIGAAPPGQPLLSQFPEDLRTPWNWPDLVLFLVFVLGSSVVFPLLAGLAAVAWWGVKPWEIDKSPATKAAILIAGQALWSVATLLYLFAVVRLRHPGPFWRTIGWRGLAPQTMSRRAATLVCLLGGVGLAVVIQAASALVGKKTRLPIEEFFRDRRSVLLLMALGVLVAPVVEETIFRGYIYPVLARGFGIPMGVAVTGTLFGLAHAAQLWGGWGQILLLVAVGVVLTYVRARTGTVLASYFFHLAYNGVLFIGFYFATGGLRHFPSGS